MKTKEILKQYSEKLSRFVEGYGDYVVEQKQWLHQNRLTQLFVVDSRIVNDFVDHLRKLFWSPDVEIRVLQVNGVARVYVYVVPNQFFRKAS